MPHLPTAAVLAYLLSVTSLFISAEFNFSCHTALAFTPSSLPYEQPFCPWHEPTARPVRSGSRAPPSLLQLTQRGGLFQRPSWGNQRWKKVRRGLVEWMSCQEAISVMWKPRLYGDTDVDDFGSCQPHRERAPPRKAKNVGGTGGPRGKSKGVVQGVWDFTSSIWASSTVTWTSLQHQIKTCAHSSLTTLLSFN